MVSAGKNDDASQPVAINRLLSSFFKEKNWRSKLELHRVFEFWGTTVVEEIAAVAQPAFFRGHVLWVKVADSIWMQQLHLQKMLLLEKINQQLHGEKVKDIHFQLSSIKAHPPEPENSKAAPLLLDKKKEQEFDKLISSLKNKDLKASLKSLWVKMQTTKSSS